MFEWAVGEAISRDGEEVPDHRTLVVAPSLALVFVLPFCFHLLPLKSFTTPYSCGQICTILGEGQETKPSLLSDGHERQVKLVAGLFEVEGFM